MTLQSKSIDIKNIYLDPENPRHEALPNEQAIIRHLVAKEKIRNLAKDIATAGSTSPIELMALVKHDKVKNGYYVFEGNRRVCALKLLDDPDKAGSNKDSQYFSSLAKDMQQRLCCAIQSKGALPLTPDGFIPRAPSRACPAA